MNVLSNNLFKYKMKMENNLINGNDETEKEELTKYNLKQKQKSKKRINLILNIILGITLFCIIIYILNLKNDLNHKELEIKYLTQTNIQFMNSINEAKKEIDKMNQQNQDIKLKSVTMLNKCIDETSSLGNEINSLKEEIYQNDIINKKNLEDLIKKNNDLKNQIKYMDDYYNIA